MYYNFTYSVKVFLIFIAAAPFIFSQAGPNDELRRLLNEYLTAVGEEVHLHQSVEGETDHLKCGTTHINTLMNNIGSFSEEEQVKIRKILTRPLLHRFIDSPSGRFRIHFDTAGINMPAYSINELADAFDFSFNLQVNQLGYQAPPQDQGAGGDNKYDVYVINTGSLYGETFFEPSGGGRYTSYIRMHNSFQGFYTTGIEAARVTAAHEYHHAVQGSYIVRESDFWYYELSATAMEDFSYDNVNDYYAYLPSYFTNPGRGFQNTNGYEVSIWNIFLEKRFDHAILRRQWEMMPQQRAMEAIATSINERGANFQEELNKFGYWMYFTRHRRDPDKYFEEGQFYPLVRATARSVDLPVTISAQPVSNNFQVFINPRSSGGGIDTLVAVITNSNVSASINSPQSTSDFTYTLHTNSTSGSVKLTDDYSISFSASEPGMWTTSEILNYQVIKDGLLPTDVDFVFPSPFSYATSSQINIPAEGDYTGEAEFYVYSSAMELVYSQSMIVLNKYIRWNARSNNNEKLPTGVYIYAIQTGNKVTKGKLVIINNE
jgi:hypothetical protein